MSDYDPTEEEIAIFNFIDDLLAKKVSRAYLTKDEWLHFIHRMAYTPDAFRYCDINTNLKDIESPLLATYKGIELYLITEKNE